MYRSARGTKHFGYRQLNTDSTDSSAPMKRSVTSVHPKRHERRADGLGVRLHGLSGLSSHKVAPLAQANKQEDLLISFDDDCSTVPQTASAAASGPQPVSQSNVDVLSLLDSSIAEKYERLPPALSEKQHAPYDPFEISEDLKNYASQNATPLHASGVTPSQQYDTSSMHHSWSSFDSFSSLDMSNAGEVESPPAAVSQNRTTDGTFAPTTASHAFVAGSAITTTQTGSETDLLTYANIPLRPGDGNKGRQAPNYSALHSYSYSDASVPSTSRTSRRHDQLSSCEATSDLNANSLVPRPVSIAGSVDWVNDAVTQLTVRNASISQSAAAVGQTLAADTSALDANVTNLSRNMKAARKKMPNAGSTFYDGDAGDVHGNAARLSSSRDWSRDNNAPPVPPRDYVRGDTVSITQSTDAIYSNVGDSYHGSVSSDIGVRRQLAEVHPFVQSSSDLYQNYSEFSRSTADNAAHSMYANVQEQSSVPRRNRSSFTEATTQGEDAMFGASTGHTTVHRVRRCVPAATLDECQAALVRCYGDVEATVRHLKVEQLTRLGIAPRERCRTLLEACSWNLESAGSVLLHELSTGSPV